MVEEKHLAASRTIWGAILILASLIWGATTAERLPTPDEIVEMVGVIVVIYGRWKATKALKV